MSHSENRLSVSSIMQTSTSFCSFASDQEKRPCLLITMHMAPFNATSQEVIELIFEKIRLICENPYSIILFYQPSDFSAPLALAYSIYSQATREIRKNVKQVIIVHPPTFINMILNVIYRIASPKFKKKLKVCPNLTELRNIVPQVFVSDEKILAFNATVDASFQLPGSLYKKELVDLIKYDGGKDYTDIEELLNLLPDQLSQLFSYLIENGTKVKGIFRKSPHTKHVKQVQSLLDQGFLLNYEMEDFLTILPKRTKEEAVHIAAAALKYFIREIPLGLWHTEWFQTVVDYAENHSNIPVNEKDDALFRLVKRQTIEMPYPTYVITKILFQLLKNVSKYSDENLMTCSNLLLIWGPNLIKPGDPNEMILYTKPESWVGILVTYYINYYDDIFTREGGRR